MAAASALDFLADLAAMKAGGASTAYQGGDSSDEDKKSKKKKKKKGKKAKKAKVSKKEKKPKKPKAEAKRVSAKRVSTKRVSTKKSAAGAGGGAASSALGFLADLAAMKAGGASTAYQGGSDSSDDGKKRKKKKKKKKRKKKGAPAMAPDIAELDEKTPEPPSHLSEIEKRKFKLKYARRKLERRKRERDKVREAKALKKGTSLNGSTDSANFGKTYIDSFVKQLQTENSLIKSKISEAIRIEELAEKKRKEQNDLLKNLGLSAAVKDITHKSLERKPGRINMLSINGELMDYGLITERKTQTETKRTQTDPRMFEQHLREEFLDDFMDANGAKLSMDIKVIAGLVESTLKFGYPRELWEMETNMSHSPSPAANKIRLRQKAEELRREKIESEKLRRKKLRAAAREKRQNINYMHRRDASTLIKSGDFLPNFRKKCKWIERTLGTNEEIMENMRERNDEFFAYSTDEDFGAGVIVDEDLDIDVKVEQRDEETVRIERRQSVLNLENRVNRVSHKPVKNYLKLKKIFTSAVVKGRAVGNISFSDSNRDWFAATYFQSSSKYHTDSAGCIGIWNFMLPSFPEYTLHSQNMITATHFHPTDAFLIFGSTLNGQILMWDLRSNKYARPAQRSNFSNGHSSPVFTMSFLPSSKKSKSAQSEDVQHILSVSNDGKLCIWRTDQLGSKPVTQSVLKPSDDQSTARQIELITTCFDYSYKDATQIVLGSDEGYLYKAEINVGGGASDNNSLSIKESINGHYGPITNVQFFPKFKNNLYDFKENVSGLYLTSSYDWTVKLWHSNSKIGMDLKNGRARPILVFDQMTDYVYDCKWNKGGKPGVFACCDGEGMINIFDLTRDFKHALITKDAIQIETAKKSKSNKASIAATTLEWTNDGKYLACGDSEGNVLFYNVHKSIGRQTLESCEAFQSVANKNIV